MIQLQPSEKFIITRQLGDPSDAATYYVQATVRDAETDDLLGVINLADKGNQRFRGTWEVCNDNSGSGRYITITSRVYTDENYTTESPDYEVQEDQYLVQQRWHMSFGAGGGTSRPGVDYKKIEEILLSILSRKQGLFKSKFPKIPTTDLSPVIEAVKEAVGEIEFPKIPTTDLSPVIEAVKDLKTQLKKAEEIIVGLIKELKEKNDLSDKEVKQILARIEKNTGSFNFNVSMEKVTGSNNKNEKRIKSLLG